MKNKILLIVITLSMIVTLPCSAKKKVEMSGNLTPSTRSISDNPPIQAWIEDDNQSLQLECSANLGVLKVSVTNENGEIICSQEVYATSGSTFQISLNRPAEIGDTLIITNNYNTLYGDLY